MDSPNQAARSAEKELARMRTQFVERVTAENLTQLLEALVTDNVLNELEKERIQEMNQTRADKARDIIDTVKKKGEKACRIMISHLRTIDPTVSCQLGLSSGPSVRLGKKKKYF
uniref:CARD domain-containing protein n=1 Tax=Oreochromis aureus TaxID=47969 RepID=A0A668REY3_OREAU